VTLRGQPPFAEQKSPEREEAALSLFRGFTASIDWIGTDAFTAW